MKYKIDYIKDFEKTAKIRILLNSVKNADIPLMKKQSIMKK